MRTANFKFLIGILISISIATSGFSEGNDKYTKDSPDDPRCTTSTSTTVTTTEHPKYEANVQVVATGIKAGSNKAHLTIGGELNAGFNTSFGTQSYTTTSTTTTVSCSVSAKVVNATVSYPGGSDSKTYIVPVIKK